MENDRGTVDGDSILIVDDIKSNIDVLAQMLSGFGYRVRIALSGKDALRACKSLAPSLILLDIDMPDLDGYTVCERLKHASGYEDIPVIFISAFKDHKHKLKAFKCGGVDYIEKPFHIEEVHARVSTHLQLVKSKKQLKAVNGELSCLFQKTFENAPIGIINLSPSQKFARVNQSFCEMCGFSSNELLAMSFWDIIDSFDNSSVEFVKRLKERGASDISSEIKILHKNGSLMWGSVRSQRQWDKNRRHEYDILTIEDITNRKETLENLAKNEARLNEAQHIAKMGSWEFYVKSNVFNASEELYYIFGRSPKEFTLNKTNLFSSIHPEDRMNLQTLFYRAVKYQEGFSGQFRLILSDLKEKIITLTCKTEYDKREKQLRLFGTVQDITRHIMLEKEMHKLAFIIQASDNAVVVANRQGYIQWVNNGFSKMTGYELEEVIGKKPGSVLQGRNSDKKVIAHISKSLKMCKSIKTELVNYKKSGEEYWVEVDIQPIFNDKSEFECFIAIERDITNRKNAEKEQRRINAKLQEEINERVKLEKDLIAAKEKAEESDRLKSAFIANLSHEIRTPMNGIIGFSNLLINSDSPEDKLAFYKNTLNESCENLLKIVEDILEVSKIQSGTIEIKNESLNVEIVLRDLYNRFVVDAKSNGLEFDLFCDVSPDVTINTDRKRIVQIFSYLIDNSIKFTKQGGIKIGCEEKGGFIQFFVKDTGIGIDKSMQKKIFQMFRQVELEISRQYGGTGVGLSIANRLVEMLGGEMHVESKLGCGASFYFTIPYLKDTNKKPVVLENQLWGIRDSFTVLVAEDEKINFLYINEVLQGAGVFVLHAQNGEEAVEMCGNHPEIALVVMDLKMPKLDGVEASRKIKIVRPNLPIIVYSAHVTANERSLIEEVGCDAFIPKPVDPVVLVANIEEYRKRYVES